MDNLDEDQQAEEIFRQTVRVMSPGTRQWLLGRLEKSSLDHRLSKRERYVLNRCLQIMSEFNGPS